MVGRPAYGWVPKDGLTVGGWVGGGSGWVGSDNGWVCGMRWVGGELCFLFLFLFFYFGGCDLSGCGLIFMGCDGLMLVGGGGCGLILAVLFFCFFWWLWPQQFF